MTVQASLWFARSSCFFGFMAVPPTRSRRHCALAQEHTFGRTLLLRQQLRVPHNFPEMTIYIFEIPRVDTPWSLVWFASHRSPGSFCPYHQRIDFFFVLHEMTKTELGGTCYSNRFLGIFRYF